MKGIEEIRKDWDKGKTTKMPILKPVVSGNIESIGYRDHTLFMLFKHGGLYAYFPVSKEVNKALMQAPSKNTYFTINIKYAKEISCKKL